MTPLAGWENFYVIVGSSAGALIGLQFVVITLIAELPAHRDLERAGNAFATPTVLHFGTVLLLSGLVSAPWRGITVPAAAWGTVGLAGVVYSLIVARRMRTQTAYKPVSEDWLFHFWLPLASYATLALAAYATRSRAIEALFAVAAASLLLLFVGIHNAWDAVTYNVFMSRTAQRPERRQ